MRSGEFLPKLHKPEVSKESIERGLYLIITGLLKKVVIADNMGSILNPVYLSPDSYSWSSLCLTNFGFAMQIYCDFGGYSDMARGLALLLGFEIPVNFRAPFLSRSFTELWSRWHITLSTWLRDYLYIPLGGNKNGPFRSNVNMLITMTLGGLWHGANITYILWGFYLGVMLWLERIGDRLFGDKFQKSYLVVPKIIIVYVLFSFSGLFFRTGMLGDKSLDICINFMRSIFTFQSGKTVYRHEELITYIVLTFVFNYIEYRGRIFDNNPLLKKVFLPIYSFLILLLLGLYGDGGGDFIYFQF
jgi:D-alanyl-lipoteichoic acid acyltransferase DltB (MBOAT superfamily)